MRDVSLRRMRPFTDDRREALRDRMRAFAVGLPRRGSSDIDAKQAARDLGAAGWFRMLVPQAFGGDAPIVEPLSLAVAREELAYGSGVHDALLAVQGLSAHPIILSGTAEQQQRWLPGLADGSVIAAFAVTEPEAGSDLAAVSTSARRDGTDYVLDGTKIFISSAGIADLYFMLARTTDGDRGLTGFVVPAASVGLETSPIELASAHPMGTVRLRGVRVPVDARVGAEGDGLSLCLRALETFRATVGASACGLARRALDESVRRVQARKQFGAPLASLDTVKATLADMATDLQAARGLVYRAAWLKEASLHNATKLRLDADAAMAKLFATETAQRIVDRALQLHGAVGLVKGSVMECLYREVRSMRIYEGTSEIQRLVIARSILAG